MLSALTNNGPKCHLNVSEVGPNFGPMKLAATTIRSSLPLVVLAVLLLVAARAAQAQTETVLYNFTGGSDGGSPNSHLTSDAAGNLYGTTFGGGAFLVGTVFELSPNGGGGWSETVLHSFGGGNSDGYLPNYSYVIFDKAGNLYGTAYAGGRYGCGVVFELSPAGASWTETLLYNFKDKQDGCFPINGLIMDPAGNLYGRTERLNGVTRGNAAVFELSFVGGEWTENVIYRHEDQNSAGLTMDAAGNLFGVESDLAFELSPNKNGGWTKSTFGTFSSAAEGTPVLDTAGNLYGTTTESANNEGTVYELSPGKKGKWTETTLYSFDGGSGGAIQPWAGIVFDAAGNIYGTTVAGGSSDDGTVFELVDPVGTGSYTEKILWSFNGTDGSGPVDSLILDTAGNLFGTTTGGGPSGYGVVFEVTRPYGVVSPTALNFGQVAVGQTSSPQDVSLKNTGTSELAVSAISISGDFVITVNHCANGVKPETHCNVYVTFNPQALGSETGTLTFVDNASNSPQTVSLTGTGVNAHPK
jgi:uncharacterized repeat protein (TIGR03803 family)